MIKVTAIANGYYGGKIRVPGEQFGIENMQAFSEVWMTKDKDAAADETRRVNTGGTDGVVGEEVLKTDAPRGKAAKGKAAKDIASGGSDNDDRSRDMAIDATANAPLPAADWEAPKPVKD
ncbi:MAG TPA: hypothetical protein VIU82_21890 [Bosea sp. (in: a-proteobacteria)]